jgi:ribosomal protein S17E
MSEKATNFFGKYTEQVNAMFKEQAGVVESMTSEWNKVRGQGLEQAQVVMEDYANLMKLSFEYQSTLFQDMQKMSADAMRNTAEMMNVTKNA